MDLLYECKKKKKVIKLTIALSQWKLRTEFLFPFSFSSYELTIYGTYGLFVIFDITKIQLYFYQKYSVIT